MQLTIIVIITNVALQIHLISSSVGGFLSYLSNGEPNKKIAPQPNQEHKWITKGKRIQPKTFSKLIPLLM